MTGALVHGDHPKVMRLLGRSVGGEMLPSIYAKHLWKCLGTVQAEPVAVGATNALEAVSYSGRSLPTVSPTQLKQLLSGSGGKASPLVKPAQAARPNARSAQRDLQARRHARSR